MGGWLIFRIRNSIREFCELDLPILMFDKDGKFCVMRLQQVCGFKVSRTEEKE
jgi:hypothetical protein